MIELDDELYQIATSIAVSGTKRAEQLEKRMSEMSDEERKIQAIQAEEYDRFRNEVIRVFKKFK